MIFAGYSIRINPRPYYKRTNMHEFFLPVIQSALRSAGIDTDKQIIIEQPADKKFGDFSTNIALLTAKECRRTGRSSSNCYLRRRPVPPS